MPFNIKNLDVPENEYLTGLQGLGSGNSALGSSSGSFDLSFLKDAFNLYQGITGFNNAISSIREGTDLAASSYREAGSYAMAGARFNAEVYRDAGKAAVFSANYNIELDKLQSQRQETALSRQLIDTLGSNWAIAGTGQIAINAKSTMMVQNDIINTATTQFLRNKNDALQRQSQIDYQGKLVEAQYENQARAAELSGTAAMKSYENQARLAEVQGDNQVSQQQDQMTGSIIGAGISLVGALL